MAVPNPFQRQMHQDRSSISHPGGATEPHINTNAPIAALALNASTWLLGLHMAILHDREDHVQYMVRVWTGTDMPHRYTPLMDASYSGHLDTCRTLLRYPEMQQTINDTDAAGNTALNYAQCTYNLQMCKLLIEHKADICGGSNRHTVPIFRACRSRDIRFLSLYCDETNVRRKKCLNLRDLSGETPLTLCISRSDTAHVIMLIESGQVDVNEHTTTGVTPLECALLAGSCELALILLRAGAWPYRLHQWLHDTQWMQSPHIRHAVYFIGYITLINSSRYIQLGRATFTWRDTRDTPVFLSAMRTLHDARDRVEPYLLPQLLPALVCIVDTYWWDCDYSVFISLLVPVAQLDSAPDL